MRPFFTGKTTGPIGDKIADSLGQDEKASVGKTFHEQRMVSEEHTDEPGTIDDQQAPDSHEQAANAGA